MDDAVTAHLSHHVLTDTEAMSIIYDKVGTRIIVLKTTRAIAFLTRTLDLLHFDVYTFGEHHRFWITSTPSDEKSLKYIMAQAVRCTLDQIVEMYRDKDPRR